MNKNKKIIIILSSVVATLLVISIIIYFVTNKKKIYTITFDSNGGADVASQKVEKGLLVDEPFSPTKKGYTFISWMLDKEDYDFDLEVESDLYLVANWKANEDTKVKNILLLLIVMEEHQ